MIKEENKSVIKEVKNKPAYMDKKSSKLKIIADNAKSVSSNDNNIKKEELIKQEYDRNNGNNKKTKKQEKLISNNNCDNHSNLHTSNNTNYSNQITANFNTKEDDNDMYNREINNQTKTINDINNKRTSKIVNSKDYKNHNNCKTHNNNMNVESVAEKNLPVESYLIFQHEMQIYSIKKAIGVIDQGFSKFVERNIYLNKNIILVDKEKKSFNQVISLITNLSKREKASKLPKNKNSHKQTNRIPIYNCSSNSSDSDEDCSDRRYENTKFLLSIKPETYRYFLKDSSNDIYYKGIILKSLYLTSFHTEKAIQVIMKNYLFKNNLHFSNVNKKLLDAGVVYIFGKDYKHSPNIYINYNKLVLLLQKYKLNEFLILANYVIDYVEKELFIPGQIECANIIIDCIDVEELRVPGSVLKLVSFLVESIIFNISRVFVLGVNVFFIELLRALEEHCSHANKLIFVDDVNHASNDKLINTTKYSNTEKYNSRFDVSKLIQVNKTFINNDMKFIHSSILFDYIHPSQIETKYGGICRLKQEAPFFPSIKEVSDQYFTLEFKKENLTRFCVEEYFEKLKNNEISYVCLDALKRLQSVFLKSQGYNKRVSNTSNINNNNNTNNFNDNLEGIKNTIDNYIRIRDEEAVSSNYSIKINNVNNINNISNVNNINHITFNRDDKNNSLSDNSNNIDNNNNEDSKNSKTTSQIKEQSFTTYNIQCNNYYNDKSEINNKQAKKNRITNYLEPEQITDKPLNLKKDNSLNSNNQVYFSINKNIGRVNIPVGHVTQTELESLRTPRYSYVTEELLITKNDKENSNNGLSGRFRLTNASTNINTNQRSSLQSHRISTNNLSNIHNTDILHTRKVSKDIKRTNDKRVSHVDINSNVNKDSSQTDFIKKLDCNLITNIDSKEYKDDSSKEMIKVVGNNKQTNNNNNKSSNTNYKINYNSNLINNKPNCTQDLNQRSSRYIDASKIVIEEEKEHESCASSKKTVKKIECNKSGIVGCRGVLGKCFKNNRNGDNNSSNSNSEEYNPTFADNNNNKANKNSKENESIKSTKIKKKESRCVVF